MLHKVENNKDSRDSSILKFVYKRRDNREVETDEETHRSGLET